MAATSHNPDEDDDVPETDPLKMFLPAAADTTSSVGEPQDQEHQLQHHFLRSIDSTVTTRQLHSRGLSFQLWPAASTLVSLLDDSRTGPLSATLSSLCTDQKRLRILELGSGTGLVGIVAAAILSANVTLTDLPHVLPNLQFNVDTNAAVVAAAGGSLQVSSLRWGEVEDAEHVGREFDLILASDVVYYDDLYEPLLETLRLLFFGGGDVCRDEKEMVFVMSHLRRWKKDSSFFKKARKMFDTEVLHVDSPRDGCRTGVAVYRFKRRSKKQDTTKTRED